MFNSASNSVAEQYEEDDNSIPNLLCPNDSNSDFDSHQEYVYMKHESYGLYSEHQLTRVNRSSEKYVSEV